MIQFVTFRLGKQLFGVDLLRVREVKQVFDITPVQHARPYIRGLVNLRGQTVVIFDMGARLGLKPVAMTEESHAIVLKDDRVGLLVDGIGDVVQTEESEIESTLADRGGMEIPFSKGVLKLKEDLLVILSAEKILLQEVSEG